MRGGRCSPRHVLPQGRARAQSVLLPPRSLHAIAPDLGVVFAHGSARPAARAGHLELPTILGVRSDRVGAAGEVCCEPLRRSRAVLGRVAAWDRAPVAPTYQRFHRGQRGAFMGARPQPGAGAGCGLFTFLVAPAAVRDPNRATLASGRRAHHSPHCRTRLRGLGRFGALQLGRRRRHGRWRARKFGGTFWASRVTWHGVAWVRQDFQRAGRLLCARAGVHGRAVPFLAAT
mmetsp:Transcript_26768/g.85177  ORF Transcript_26768/g.85177 Transcript_26768/m.85177 type:complete len:231 (-) Transcript_26768:526-1218(-)